MNSTTYSNTCTVYNDKLTCFQELTKEQQELIDKNKLVVKFNKGEIICKQGSFASHIIYLRKGLAKVYLEGRTKNLILNITPANNLIGLPSIYEGNNVFLYSAATYTSSEVELIEIHLFKQLIQENAKFAFKLINLLNSNTVQIHGRFYCLTNKQLHGRMADILLCLSERIYCKKDFDLPLNRSELAELTGMSTESVIRVMKDFKDDGLIESSGKTIKILNFEMMSKISDFG